MSGQFGGVSRWQDHEELQEQARECETAVEEAEAETVGKVDAAVLVTERLKAQH